MSFLKRRRLSLSWNPFSWHPASWIRRHPFLGSVLLLPVVLAAGACLYYTILSLIHI